MCGRVTLTVVSYEKLCEALGLEGNPSDAALYRARYNVAPTDPHWIVRSAVEEEKDSRRKRSIEPARWGLINFWAKDEKRAAQQINARSESVATTRAYREAYDERRCVVPVDGWYEWFGSPKDRRPVRFHRADGGLSLLAGLWEDWRDAKTGAKRRTFTVLTTGAKGVMANFHDRMPVRVPPRHVEGWLAAQTPVDAIVGGEMDDEWVLGTEVSKRVNSVKNDDPGCLGPPEPAPPGTTGSLF